MNILSQLLVRYWSFIRYKEKDCQFGNPFFVFEYFGHMFVQVAIEMIQESVCLIWGIVQMLTITIKSS
ncbi:hypothetical protein D3C87_262200 [compost metagenome]